MLLAGRPAADDSLPGLLSLPAVGDTLDGAERERFGILGEYCGFRRALFHVQPDSYVTASVVLLVNGSERVVTLPRYRHALLLRSWFEQDPARIERPKVKPGAFVTVRLAAGGQRDAELISVRDTAVVVAVTPRTRERFGSIGPDQLLIVRNPEISEIVVYRDGKALRRMGTGLVIGGAAGALIGYAGGDPDPSGWFEFTRSEGAAFFGSMGALCGFTYGGVKALVSSWDWNVDPRNRESMDFVREKARYPEYEPKYLHAFR